VTHQLGAVATAQLHQGRAHVALHGPLAQVVDGLLTIRGEASPLSLATTLTPQADGLAVHATGTFDRMGSALRKAPRWLIGSEVQVVVDAVLQPAPDAR
jgi:polyisoprenoid-binding protein YceI